MEKFLDDRRWAPKREDIQVLVSGQSLGGALSQLAVLVYREQFPDLTVIPHRVGRGKITIAIEFLQQWLCASVPRVTFGAFRIGGDKFQQLYDKHLVEPGR